jgi:AMP nucleosidase
MPLDKFGVYILLTNFRYYLTKFAEKFNTEIYGENRPMPSATNGAGLSIVNFGIGSATAASGSTTNVSLPA